MHDVVEMLLNRIKDYPEDFVEEPSDKSLIGQYSRWSKWKEALNIAYQVATDEEKLALDEATTDAKRAIYMGAALKTIMSEEVEKPEPNPYTFSSMGHQVARINAAGNLGVGIASTMSNTAANSIQIGNAQLTEDKINMITEIEKRQKAAEARIAQALYKQEYIKCS